MRPRSLGLMGAGIRPARFVIGAGIRPARLMS